MEGNYRGNDQDNELDAHRGGNAAIIASVKGRFFPRPWPWPSAARCSSSTMGRQWSTNAAHRTRLPNAHGDLNEPDHLVDHATRI